MYKVQGCNTCKITIQTRMECSENRTVCKQAGFWQVINSYMFRQLWLPQGKMIIPVHFCNLHHQFIFPWGSQSCTLVDLLHSGDVTGQRAASRLFCPSASSAGWFPREQPRLPRSDPWIANPRYGYYVLTQELPLPEACHPLLQCKCGLLVMCSY